MAVVRLVVGFIVYISKGVLVSTLATAVGFVLIFSVVTQKIPTKISDFEDAISNIRMLLNVAKKYASLAPENQSVNLHHETSKRMPSVDEMIEIHENKLKLGRDIAGVLMPPNQNKESEDSKKEIQKLQNDIEFLKSRVLDLENQTSR